MAKLDFYEYAGSKNTMKELHRIKQRKQYRCMLHGLCELMKMLPQNQIKNKTKQIIMSESTSYIQFMQCIIWKLTCVLNKTEAQTLQWLSWGGFCLNSSVLENLNQVQPFSFKLMQFAKKIKKIKEKEHFNTNENLDVRNTSNLKGLPKSHRKRKIMKNFKISPKKTKNFSFSITAPLMKIYSPNKIADFRMVKDKMFSSTKMASPEIVKRFLIDQKLPKPSESDHFTEVKHRSIYPFNVVVNNKQSSQLEQSSMRFYYSNKKDAFDSSEKDLDSILKTTSCKQESPMKNKEKIAQLGFSPRLFLNVISKKISEK